MACSRTIPLQLLEWWYHLNTIWMSDLRFGGKVHPLCSYSYKLNKLHSRLLEFKNTCPLWGYWLTRLQTTVGCMQLKDFPWLNSERKHSSYEVLLAPWTYYNMRMIRKKLDNCYFKSNATKAQQISGTTTVQQHSERWMLFSVIQIKFHWTELNSPCSRTVHRTPLFFNSIRRN